MDERVLAAVPKLQALRERAEARLGAGVEVMFREALKDGLRVRLAYAGMRGDVDVLDGDPDHIVFDSMLGILEEESCRNERTSQS